MQKKLLVLQAGLLWTTGLLGVVFALLSFVGQLPTWFNPQGAILTVLGMLALALGLERAVLEQVREAKLDSIVSDGRTHAAKLDTLASDIRSLGDAAGVQVLENYDEIYDAATRLVKEAKRHVRATITSGRQSAPEKYREAIIKVLKESAERNDPVYNDIVVTVETADSIQWEMGMFEKRMRLYKDEGVADQVRIYLAQTPAMFDVLIVDDRHAIVAFSVRDPQRLQSGYVFRDQPKIAREMASWYDQVLKPHAKQLKEPVAEVPSANPSNLSVPLPEQQPTEPSQLQA